MSLQLKLKIWAKILVITRDFKKNIKNIECKICKKYKIQNIEYKFIINI